MALRTTLPAGDESIFELRERSQPALFLAFACDGLAAGPARYLLGEVDVATVGRGVSRRAEIEEATGTRKLEITLTDPRISSAHFSIRRAGGGWELADAGARNGTIVNGNKVERALLADGDLIEAGRTFFLFRKSLSTFSTSPAVLDGGALDLSMPGLATLLPQLEEEFARLRAVAADNMTIAIQGESGTGKELLASAVHKLSGRPGPFLALNCGALPPTLIASELFGYRKGAFSGADEDRPGLFRSAERGTLLLDEIGDLPAEAQPALLRALQEGEVLPVGATRPVKIDVRVVCATSRDLRALASDGRFRRDLYERLAGYTAILPALRNRAEDIGLIAMALLRKLNPRGAESVRFVPDAARALLKYDWPGNVRELEHCLRVALRLAGDGAISLAHLGAGPQRSLDSGPREERVTPPELSDAQLKRRQELVDLLTAHAGNVSAVARAMGKDRVQVHRWLKRLELDARRFRR